ncbi:MAG: hypothetical protein P4L51_06695 [Puia sp.]|nr:hypothetical protein [Puia sp.]
MTDRFESEKNIKASGYTLLICVLLAILFIYVSWTHPVQPPPVVEDGIEVNLGNSDQGMGSDQPYLPGKPAAHDEEKYTAPAKAVVAKEATKDVETDDKQTEEAPVIKKPAITKPNATKLPDKEVLKAKPVKIVKTEAPPAPVKPRPKALFHGVNGNGTGGNDADDYKPGGSEGVAGGHGDQGRPGGDPNSKSYTGGGNGNSGVAISRGLQGRRIAATPSFTDDFNQNAKVAVDVHVDANGNVTDADYQPRGSTTSDGSMKAIALRKAKQVKFTAGSDESVGTLIFNFKVKD